MTISKKEIVSLLAEVIAKEVQRESLERHGYGHWTVVESLMDEQQAEYNNEVLNKVQRQFHSTSSELIAYVQGYLNDIQVSLSGGLDPDLESNPSLSENLQMHISNLLYEFYPDALDLLLENPQELPSSKTTIRNLLSKLNIDTATYEQFLERFALLEFYCSLLSDGRQIEARNKARADYTHRVRILERQYLVKTGVVAKMWTAGEMKGVSQRRYEAFLSLSHNSKTKPYKEPSTSELLDVIELLKDFPEARKIAQSDLEKQGGEK